MSDMEDRETIIRSMARICCARECGEVCKGCDGEAWMHTVQACLAAAEAGGYVLARANHVTPA